MQDPNREPALRPFHEQHLKQHVQTILYIVTLLFLTYLSLLNVKSTDEILEHDNTSGVLPLNSYFPTTSVPDGHIPYMNKQVISANELWE